MQVYKINVCSKLILLTRHNQEIAQTLIFMRGRGLGKRLSGSWLRQPGGQ